MKWINLIIFAFLILSCSDDILDTCPEQVDLGDFYLAPNSVEFYPYDTSQHRQIVFSDSIGNEYIAAIRNYESGLRNFLNLTEFKCEDDTTQTYLCYYQPEYKVFEADLDEFNIQLRIALRVIVRKNQEFRGSVNRDILDDILLYDGVDVTLRTTIDSTNYSAGISIIANPRNNPEPLSTALFRSEFILHNIVYSDVYYSRPPSLGRKQKFFLYYNKTNGLIGIKIPDNQVSLKFERFE